jgi:GNAT superfamily N-acetyltransferase
MIAAITIRRYLEVTPSSKLSDEIDAIFFEASNTKLFESDAARAAFRERWLGRYLRNDPQFAHLAFAAPGTVAGYVVGAIDDPASSERFADVGYVTAFGDLTSRFPAHLHINLAPAFRNRGIGGRLIEAFVAEVKRNGAPGVHVVTSANSDNVRFYNRNGFIEVGRTKGSTPLVFLARTLPPVVHTIAGSD